MLRAEQEGIAPDTLVERVSAEHRQDFATFRISVDNYLTTHAPENEELTDRALPPARRRAASSAARSSSRPTTQRGRCSCRTVTFAARARICGAPDQYGDSCENCGATYSPLELKDAVSTVSGTRADGARVGASVPEARPLRERAPRRGSPSTSTQRSRASSTSGSRRASRTGTSRATRPTSASASPTSATSSSTSGSTRRLATWRAS